MFFFAIKRSVSVGQSPKNSLKIRLSLLFEGKSLKFNFKAFCYDEKKKNLQFDARNKNITFFGCLSHFQKSAKNRICDMEEFILSYYRISRPQNIGISGTRRLVLHTYYR